MKRFHFPLEKARDWRKITVEREEEKMQRLFAERNLLDQQMRNIEAEQKKLDGELSLAPSRFAEELAAMDSWRQFLIRRRAALAAARAGCESKIQAQRLALLEARRQLQLLQKLEARKKSEWQQAFDQEQENLASELHLARMHGRNKQA
jgi:flagellar biosynthesis chaperone FliJ